ncbi:histidine--tRNA ligase [Streptomyces nigrescens]|uniref:Histidine--tRNA ligase n=1 Tax=Streptomyces nigrescens TaxID=1920 RepID=A0ABY7J109_STRNI|nr:histidine--tRNA ligase [Streptomyces nigrescens]WAU03987.1 histidine--tRNA ligase [Streptomyces nigrescens]
MGQAAQTPSGTRDLLADEVRRRRAAFNTLSQIFENFGFDPLETPAFENLDVITGKYGEEASKLIFKILKRGVHEASGQADLALRYDHTVPLARVIGTHGAKLPTPYKRYAIGPVWRADRPQEGRFREFVQCDIDTVGSHSPLADAEIVLALAKGLDGLGVHEFTFMVNSRKALYALLDVYGIDPAGGPGVLGTLDKLDKIGAEAVAKELTVDRGLTPEVAEALVGDVAADTPDRVRERLDATEEGKAGLAEVDRLIELTTSAGLASEHIVYAPRMVRGLDYYTGVIYEVEAAGYPGSIAAGGRYDQLVASLGGPDRPACGGSIGVERILAIQGSQLTEQRGLDVALTVLGGEEDLMRLAAELRDEGLRVGTYLGSSTKLAKQLKWANEQNARITVLYGPDEQAAGEVTLRDMQSGDQTRVPLPRAAAHLRNTLEGP